ncbi:hypothetical protein CMK11_02160 [Candidatus Poribacteria bacterium]|nr:hypothetical protein [Candidatus Poribacteria bacterium]
MGDAATSDERTVRACLRLMSVPSGAFDLEILSGGASGSHVYGVTLPERACVLKVTLATAEPHMLERSRREVAFYSQMVGAAPVRVPDVLGSYEDTAAGVCLLLKRYEAARPARDWTAGDFETLARQLADLHSAYWASPPERLAWLDLPPDEDAALDTTHARGEWAARAGQAKFRSVLNRSAVGQVNALLDRIADMNAAIRSTPSTLCHGDCHVGNILTDVAGVLVWSDWQEVRWGPGPEDLSFLLQRAEFDGATPCRELLISAYHAQLRRHVDVSRRDVQRVMDACELRTRLVAWPMYLAGASEDAMRAMLARIAALAHTLSLGGV